MHGSGDCDRVVHNEVCQTRAAAATTGAEAGGSNSHSGARIAVRHVQSGYERRFVSLDDAMDFIREEIRLLEQD